MQCLLQLLQANYIELCQASVSFLFLSFLLSINNNNIKKIIIIQSGKVALESEEWPHLHFLPFWIRR